MITESASTTEDPDAFQILSALPGIPARVLQVPVYTQSPNAATSDVYRSVTPPVARTLSCTGGPGSGLGSGSPLSVGLSLHARTSSVAISATTFFHLIINDSSSCRSTVATHSLVR